MGEIRFHPREEIELKKIRDRAGHPRHRAFDLMADSELDSYMAFHEFGGANDLQLAELDYIPHAEAVAHKHDEAEIIYVLRGELILGDRTITAGGSIYIAGGTTYGFRAGPDGLRILNFRARADVSVYFQSKEPSP